MSNKYLTEKIEKIEEYIPNTDEFIIRLDANESPFLPSEKVLDSFKKEIDNIAFDRYPDPFATELVEKFAEVYGIKSENVVAGNGSDELISLICSGFCENGTKVAVAMPDFSMYKFYSGFSGANVIKYQKDETLKLNLNDFAKMIENNNVKIAIFSNPCNPTGQIVKKSELIEFIEKTDALVIADEAYMEFSDSDESVLGLVDKYDNLIVLKTLSKAFGSAALRLGFAVANREIISAIKKIKSPYNVNTISQCFGKIILDNQAEIEEKVSIIKNNVRYLYDKINELNCDAISKIYDTKTNFVLVKMKSADDGKKIFEYLKRKKIAIRCMSGGAYLRITAGTIDEIDSVIKEIEASVK